MICPFCKEELEENRSMPYLHTWVCPSKYITCLGIEAHYETGNKTENPLYYRRTVAIVMPYKVVIQHTSTSIYVYDNKLITKDGLNHIITVDKRIKLTTEDALLSKIKTYVLMK